VYVGQFGIGGQSKVLSAALTSLKSLSKAFYIFSPDDAGKVAHVNYLPKEVLDSKVLDAKIWLGEVSKVIGGKVSRVVRYKRSS